MRDADGVQVVHGGGQLHEICAPINQRHAGNVVRLLQLISLLSAAINVIKQISTGTVWQDSHQLAGRLVCSKQREQMSVPPPAPQVRHDSKLSLRIIAIAGTPASR